MEKLYLLFTFLLFNVICNSQIINIPDTNLKARLLQASPENNIAGVGFNLITFIKIDTNEDGEIDVNEALQVTYLNLSNSSINNLTGLDFFINLNDLNISENYSFSSFYFPTLVSLINLDCSRNNISSLDATIYSNLNKLLCGENILTELDVSGLENLTIVNCRYNLLTNLDFSTNPNFIYLGCEGNNNLQSINVKNNKNQITLPNLDVVEEIDFWGNNPSLSYVCADEEEIELIQNQLSNPSGPFNNSVSLNSYCSFTPGGAYYTIHGVNQLDINNNGCDSSDLNFPSLQFLINDGISGSFISNESGNYSIPVQQGTHTITPVLENPNYFTVSPASVSVSFPSATSPFTQDFCITANGVKNDVEVSIIPIEVARPGFDAEYKIIYKNKGNQVANGSVSFGFDDAIMDLVSATPINDGNATNSLSWNYTNLNPFETREIDLVFNINSPMEIPAVNGDDVLDYTATIVGTTDETPNDNNFTLNQIVVNSYDPNDKTCLEGSTITPSMVGQYVHYVIRFENTGTFAAENIVVKDMIDTTKFDIATLVPQHSSHDFFTRITNTNKVEFIFENINLPFDDANNDGYVAFKIKTKPTLVLGDTFSNEASIYFDYNFPIITEPAVTTVAALSNQDFDFESYFTLYPNPVKDALNFEVKNEIGVKSIQVYNTLGQIVLAVTNASTTRSIDVASLNAGVYFIKVVTDRGSANSKFIKE